MIDQTKTITTVCGFPVIGIDYTIHSKGDGPKSVIWKCTVTIVSWPRNEPVKVSACSRYPSQAFGRVLSTIDSHNKDIVDGVLELERQELHDSHTNDPEDDFDAAGFIMGELPIPEAKKSVPSKPRRYINKSRRH